MLEIKNLNENDRIIIWQYKGMNIDEGHCATVVGLSYKNFSQDTAVVQLDEVPHKIELTDTDYFDKLPISHKKSKDYEDCKNVPSHYAGQTDVIEFTRQQFTKDEWIAAMKFNIIKYATRLGRKDEVDKEIDKIINYAQRLKEGL